MRKRIVASLLACVMAVGMLVGCGGNAGKSTETTQSSSPAQSESEVVSESKEEVKADPTHIKWIMYGAEPKDFDRVMEDLNKKLVEKINVELEIEMIPSGDYEERIKLATASGEDFDIMWVSNWRNNFDNHIAQEGLLPLNDLLEEYGQDIVDSFGTWMLDHARVEGEVYAVPARQMIARQLGVMVQKKYADEYGLNVTEIDDIRELFPFFEWCKEKYPDMIPLQSKQIFYQAMSYEPFANGFVQVDMKDGKIYSLTEQRELIGNADAKLDREMFDKGIIRSDIVTVTDDSALVKANKYVAILNTYQPGGAAKQSTSTGVEWIDIKVGEPFMSATAAQATMNAINVNSKNPEAAMTLLNTIYTDKEIYNEVIFGIEGVHYVKDGENRVKLVEDSGYNRSGMAWVYGDQFLAYLMPGMEDDVYEETNALNENAVKSSLTGFAFDSSNVQSELAQLDSVKKEYENMVYTTKDIDAYLKEYSDKLAAAGLETVKEEFVKQVDAWKAANGK